MMFNNESLFALALQIKEPLYVKQIEFQQEQGELHMYIDFRTGARFRCALCGKEGLTVHDTTDNKEGHTANLPSTNELEDRKGISNETDASGYL
ncbi:MAG: hypothetical protein PHT62_08620 [Desulfotomaculaceae bacterium]|nr:hypothetical protein [Desulfotomaculaceae bacterium]